MTRLFSVILLVTTTAPAWSQPMSRPSDRASRMRRAEMMRSGYLPDEEFDRPTDEVFAEFLKEDDRRLLDVQLQVLRYKTLSNDHVDQLIKATELESSESKRVYLWVALYNAQSSTAREFLLKTLTAQADPGMLLAFLQTLRVVHAAEVPLLTQLYEQHPSELVRDEIVRFATRSDRFVDGRRDEPEHLQLPARAALLGWLLRHAHTPLHRAQVVASYHRVAGWGPASLQEIRDYLEQEKSAEARRVVYESLLRMPSEELATMLLLRETDAQVQLAGLKVIRAQMDDREASAPADDPGAGSFAYLVKPLKEAVSAAQTSEEVKAQIRPLLDRLRKRAVESTVQSARRLATSLSNMPPEHRERQIQMLRHMRGRDIGRTIESLKRQYGELPEEDELRQRLLEAQEELDKAIDSLSS
ncbi:MAG: hypothetical protein AMXMBFR13_32780 [Phycisphaerae bacterium]